MRRLLRDIAAGEPLGDLTTLRDPRVMGELEQHFVGGSGAALAQDASDDQPKPPRQSWSFYGIFGTFDQAQLQRGFAIGPQTELAGEVAELFCELTGNERATFCNTGSEAVMAALRVARTVTNRERVVVFEGAYHGQFDEVLVKSARTSRRSLPVALGIPAEAVANITVLPYGESESLEWVREHQNELAAVVVESVQSRHPALRPKEFLAELRRITEASGTAFVFDEVVTGFRMHPGGMQEIFGIRADLGTYGKWSAGVFRSAS